MTGATMLIISVALMIQACTLVLVTVSQRAAERKLKAAAWDIDKIKRDLLDLKVDWMDFLQAIREHREPEEDMLTEEESNGSNGSDQT